MLSILTLNITNRHGMCTAQDWRALQRVIKTAQNIIVLSISDIGEVPAQSPKDTKRECLTQPLPVHPAAVWQDIQKYPQPYHQTSEQLFFPKLTSQFHLIFHTTPWINDSLINLFFLRTFCYTGFAHYHTTTFCTTLISTITKVFYLHYNLYNSFILLVFYMFIVMHQCTRANSLCVKTYLAINLILIRITMKLHMLYIFFEYAYRYYYTLVLPLF